MATPAHITMLREISAAGDRERTGALDVEWEGAHASLFFIFGHPSHVVFESSDGRRLVGDDALTTLVAELPPDSRVAPWRRAMVTEDTLHLSAEDLMELFAADHPQTSEEAAAAVDVHEPEDGAASESEPRADAAADDDAATETREDAANEPATAALDDPEPHPETVDHGLAEAQPQPEASADVPRVAPTGEPSVGMTDFPLLPLGRLLFSDAMANVVNLEAVIPRLPDCLLVLTGPQRQATALVTGGVIADAAWITPDGGMLGPDAAAALMSSTEGHLLAHRLDDPRLAMTLPVLWRGRRQADDASEVADPDAIVADVQRAHSTCAVLVAADDPGVALFHEGELVAVYTADHRWPATTAAALRALLHSPGARITVAVAEAAAVPSLDTADVSAADDPTVPEVADEGTVTVADSTALEVPGSEPEVDEQTGDDQAQVEEHAPAEAELLSWAAVHEFVPTRLDIDIDALRADLTGVAVEWLGAHDAAPVMRIIAAARPGVDDFVATIAAIRTMEIPGHDAAVMRAMAREMHYRATEVLCGV